MEKTHQNSKRALSRRSLWGLLLGLLFLSLACSLVAGNAALTQAEKKWKDRGVTNYTIEVRDIHSIWHAQIQKITVRDGKVVESSADCLRAPVDGQACKLEDFDPNMYTVPGLFSLAHSQMKSQEAKWTKITYNQDYGYPESIGYDDPQIMDEDWGVIVSRFEVLK